MSALTLALGLLALGSLTPACQHKLDPAGVYKGDPSTTNRNALDEAIALLKTAIQQANSYLSAHKALAAPPTK